jgi:hypothetical protein
MKIRMKMVLWLNALFSIETHKNRRPTPFRITETNNGDFDVTFISKDGTILPVKGEDGVYNPELLQKFKNDMRKNRKNAVRDEPGATKKKETGSKKVKRSKLTSTNDKNTGSDAAAGGIEPSSDPASSSSSSLSVKKKSKK